MSEKKETTRSNGDKIVVAHAEYIHAHHLNIARDIDAALSAARAEGAEAMRLAIRKSVSWVARSHPTIPATDAIKVCLNEIDAVRLDPK